MLTDRHGYLYIGTDNGVVKYNGYTFKSYNLIDPDVWDIYEDKKGKIWLYRISDELGYIYNDKYRKVYSNSLSFPYLYPRYPKESANRLVFLGTYGTKIYINYVLNDTLYTYKTKLKGVDGNTVFLSQNLELFHTRDSGLFQINFKGTKETVTRKWGKNANSRISMLNNCVLLQKSAHQLSLLNINDLSEQTINLVPGEHVQNTYHNKGKGFIITNKSVYILKDTSGAVKYNLVNYMTESQLHDNKVMYMIQDSFWNTCISTIRSGVYMSLNIPNFKKFSKTKIAGYKYIGIDADNLYWWNNDAHTLAAIDKHGNIKEYLFREIEHAESIIPYDANKMILICRSGYYSYDIKSSKVAHLFEKNKNYRYISTIEPLTNYTSDTTPVPSNRMASGIAGAYAQHQLVTVNKSGYLYDYKWKKNSLIQTELHSSKYIGLVHDTVLKCFIAYDNKSVFINKGNKVYEFKNIVNHLGIKRIKKICIDQKYGNVFFQGENKIVVYNYYTNKFKPILKNHKLDKAKMNVSNNMLIIAGRFGVLFSNLKGPLKISQPIVYQNTKSLVYNDITDLANWENKTIINTDSGLLFVENPTCENLEKNEPGQYYNLTVSYGDTMHTIHTSDTLFLDQENTGILLDIVKPTGVGLPRFKVKEKNSDTWRYLNGNEFTPATYKPGDYYHLQVQVEDEIWKSNALQLVIYFRPYWWQTTVGKILIGIGYIIAIIAVTFMVVYYTRKTVIKNHIKKNYLLSLELKSIYAQINPHFIFNTLTTGLYFISENRNKDAYTHISSFSELLRSYIKSSRNRYITLAEEIENIENYINLQQYRFEEKFEYTIDVDNKIDTQQKRIPGLLFQPFVENAINHGLLNKKEKGHLIIKIISGREENVIICIVEDDGIGRAASKRLYDARKNKPASYGNELIQDLIKIINADDQLRIGITYIDHQEPLSGTKVVITVKEVHHE